MKRNPFCEELISVVVPAYNESRRIAGTCTGISAYLKEAGAKHEILVVDDGSTDGSLDVLSDLCAKEKNVRFISLEKNMGKGRSVKEGVLQSRGDRILVTDADSSTPITELSKLSKKLDSGYSIAIGSRAIAGSEVRRHQPLYREYSGKSFNLLVRIILSLRIRDTQCGFKLFRRDAAEKIFARQKLDGFAFDVELMHIACKMGYGIAEVPVVWSNSDSTSVDLIKEPLKMFYDLFRIWRNEKRGDYRG